MTFGQQTGRRPSFSATEASVPAVDNLTKQVQQVVDAAKARMKHTQERQQVIYNCNRRDIKLQCGDEVLLSREGISLAVSSSYHLPFIGPYKVVETLDHDNYKLELPPTMRIHPVFHISKLRKYASDDALN